MPLFSETFPALKNSWLRAWESSMENLFLISIINTCEKLSHHNIEKSFIKRLTSGASSDNEWQRVVQQVTINDKTHSLRNLKKTIITENSTKDPITNNLGEISTLIDLKITLSLKTLRSFRTLNDSWATKKNVIFS